MKLRIIAVLAVLALGTLASAQTFGFASVGGGSYCNYETLYNNGDDVYTGIDNVTNVCYAGDNLSYNGAIAGFTAALPNAGLPVHGAGIDYGDSIYEAQEADINEFYLDYYGYNRLLLDRRVGSSLRSEVQQDQPEDRPVQGCLRMGRRCRFELWLLLRRQLRLPVLLDPCKGRQGSCQVGTDDRQIFEERQDEAGEVDEVT